MALWLLWLGVSVAAGLAISPGLYGQQLPALRPTDVGKPFSTSSPSGFKAGRDYELANQALTEQRRQEARAAVRAVYDYNPSVVPELRQGLHEAFLAMQETLAKLEGEGAFRPLADPGKKHLPEPDAVSRFSVQLLAAREAFEQRLFPLDNEDFEALLAARFSREVELATTSLFERAYAAPVVASRDDLGPGAGSGITVRELGEETEHTSPVSAPAVNDVREAKAELDRFASLPGNLLPESPALLRRAVLRLAKRQVRPNLTVNTAETEARRARAAHEVKPAVVQIRRGQKLIGDGELITEEHLNILQGMRAQRDQLDLFQIQLGGMGLVALLIGAVYAFHRTAFRRFRPTRKDAALLALLLVGLLALVRFGIAVADALHEHASRFPVEALYDAVPIAAGAMLVRFILSEELALFFSIVVACLAGVMLGNSLPYAVFALVGSLVGAHLIPRAKDRVGIFRAGLVTGGVNFALVLVLALAQGKGLSMDGLVTALFAGVGCALGAPMLVVALTPLLELGFGYASDIKLMELANLNHPALKELIVQSPGTYHHSIIVGSLVEGAAEAIGANPLLARSCAYYHDIGKGKNPLYFGENQKGENRHDCLAPSMSALIIKRHVTDGLEMARHYKLPKAVVDVIAQHHGTRLVGYFFHKACKELEGKEGGVDEDLFRYAGPKPQFREAALVMVADAVEAASRSMPDPTTAKLQALVQKIIHVVFTEGQLDDCDLTLRDLNLVAHSFLTTLEGIYHTRPSYPPGAVGGPRQALSLAPEPVTPKRTVSH